MRVSRWLVAAGVMLMVASGQAALAQASSATTSTQLNSQQQKMKTCNVDAKAKNLKGADYKAFMKTCLSGSG